MSQYASIEAAIWHRFGICKNEKRTLMPAGFIAVARVGEIPQNRSKRVRVGDMDVALWHVNGMYFAVNNVCAHQHVSALHQGILKGTTISCPMHGWTYSLETGMAESGNGRIKTYKVRIEGQDILVQQPASDW